MSNDVRVGVVGAGLIGGSLCHALRVAGVSDIVVSSKSPTTISEVQKAGFRTVDTVAELVDLVDTLFVCVPLTVQMAVFADINDALVKSGRTNIVVTDVSSVKGDESSRAVAMFAERGVTFIPGHPMAGTEESGFAAADGTLFQGATWVLCPENASEEDLASVMRLVLSTGARVSVLDIASHDASVASVSHMPYVVAAALANALPDGDMKDLALRLSAGSFRDGTRVAGSAPWLSASMVTFNRSQMLRVLPVLQAEISSLETALKNSDDDAVLAFFERAFETRRLYNAVKGELLAESAIWPREHAVERALESCRSGALISSFDVTAENWNVQLER